MVDHITLLVCVLHVVVRLLWRWMSATCANAGSRDGLSHIDKKKKQAVGNGVDGPPTATRVDALEQSQKEDHAKTSFVGMECEEQTHLDDATWVRSFSHIFCTIKKPASEHPHRSQREETRREGKKTESRARPQQPARGLSSQRGQMERLSQ